MSEQDPSDEVDKTVVGPRPDFDDVHDGGAAPAAIGKVPLSRGPTITRSPMPPLHLPRPPGSDSRRLDLPAPPRPEPATGAPSGGHSSLPRPAPGRPAPRDPSAPVPLPMLPGPQRSFSTAGPLSVIAVVVVIVVAAVFVGGTQTPSEKALSTSSVPLPAGRRAGPERPRSWQDAYRGEHPELMVGAPKLPWLGATERRTVRRLPQAARPRGDGIQWTPKRVAEAEFAAPLPFQDAPAYPGVTRPADRVTAAPAMLRVVSIPPGARVELGERLLGATPLARGRPPNWRPDPVTLSLPGWRSVTVPFAEDGDGNLVVEVRLEPDPAADPRLRGESGAPERGK